MELPVSPAAKLGKGGVGGAAYLKATLPPRNEPKGNGVDTLIIRSGYVALTPDSDGTMITAFINENFL
jgi:hypothetical protein